MNRLLLKNILFTVLLCVAAAALYQLAVRYPLQHDYTQSASNSLDESSVQALQQLPGPLQLTVYATAQDAKLGDLRKLIREFVALYQRYKPDITLTFVDPLKQPDEARKADMQVNGEMLVEYKGRREHLTTLSEQSLTSALLRLAHTKANLVMYVDGHGERRLEGPANHDLGEFGKRLIQNGFNLSPLNLTLAQDVPQNASMLIITQPQTDMMPGEVDKLLRYVANGGNLLWLVDAEPLHGLERLAEELGVMLTPGIVIDPASVEMGAPANWALGAGYPPHAVTQNFNLITAFPFARAIAPEEGRNWQYDVLVEAAPRGWVSTRPMQDKPRFDDSRDVPGPVDIALALQRSVDDREQRIIVVGSGSFLANAYSGNGGNLDLGINMVNWLANEEKLITLQPRAIKDGAVNMSKTQLALIGGGFLFALPALLVLAGGCCGGAEETDMPELPEVETTLRGLEPHLTGQRIADAVIRQPHLRWEIPRDCRYILRNQTIRALQRRAKYLLVECDSGMLILHLGMSGSLRILPADVPPKVHEHFDLVLENGTLMRLRDPRRFGAVLWHAGDPAQHPLLAKLGPEPLEQSFDADHLYHATRTRSIAIKLAIMDSHVVVGVGNIYANEALFRAGIRPQLAANKLSKPRSARLVQTLREVLTEAIALGGSTLRDFVGTDGNTGYFQQHYFVYGRGGEPCRVCATPIKHIQQGQRSSFYCPQCQK